MQKRNVLWYRTPRAKPRGHVAVIQQSVFDSSRTDGRELPDSAALSQVSINTAVSVYTLKLIRLDDDQDR